MGVSIRLMISVVVFGLHALLPFISIEPENDLEATTAFLLERNHWIEAASERDAKELYPDHRHDRSVTV